MKIKDERDCCDVVKDLRPYRGAWAPTDYRLNLKFCVHCGQLWASAWVPSPAGDVRVRCYPGQAEKP